jgi:hypothetical protein
MAWRTDHWTRAGFGARVRPVRRHADTAGRKQRDDVVRAGRSGFKTIDVALFDYPFLTIFELKCYKQCIPKLYTSHSFTTFVKGVWPFSPPMLHKWHAKITVF